MNRKKLLSVLLAVVLIANITACSSVKTTTQNDATKIDSPAYFSALKSQITASITDGEIEVPISDSTVRFFGRTYVSNSIFYFNWSGSGFEFNFKGTDTFASFETNGTSVDNDTYLDVYVDNNAVPATICLNSSGKVPLAQGLQDKEHTIKVIKRTNARSSRSGLMSLTINNGGQILTPPAAKTRKMEFIGDSITVGYGVLDPTAGSFYTTRLEDTTKTYAALVANRFNADYNVTAISGRGIVRNTGGDTDKLLPDIYEYLDAYNNPGVAWDFNKYQPDVILVNLGTNDASGSNPDLTNDQFKAGCKSFLQRIRTLNPNAQIIYAYGVMTTKFKQQIIESVDELKDAGDSKINYVDLPSLNSTDEKGTNGHPNVIADARRAYLVAQKITEVTGWECNCPIQ